MDLRQLSTLMFSVLLCMLALTECHAWNAEQVSSNSGSSSSSGVKSSTEQKRQLVPLPRIGRSFYPAEKRQSLLLASPRIGRSSPELSKLVQRSSKSSSDCSTNPDQCENVDSAGGLYRNDDLIDPIDIQLRAAFIPRLGKRGIFMEDSVADGQQQTEEQAELDTNQQPFNGRRYYYAASSLAKAQQPRQQYYSSAQRAPEEGDSNAVDDSRVELANDFSEQIRQLNQNQRALIRALLEAATNSKRAIPYTPRIGRAVFAPRIGKKATFVPRIG